MGKVPAGIMLTLLQVFGTAVAVAGFVGVFLSLSLWMMLLVLVVIAARFAVQS